MMSFYIDSEHKWAGKIADAWMHVAHAGCQASPQLYNTVRWLDQVTLWTLFMVAYMQKLKHLQ